MSYRIQAGDTSIDATSVVNGVAIYNVVVNVVRNTKVNSSEGVALTPVIIVANMLCAIKWTSGKERMMFAKKTHFLDAVLRCRVPAGVTITTTDEIVYNGVTYEIVDVIDWRNLGTLLVIGIRKVT